MGECCLVTGGAGFIGSHLVEHLLEVGEQVRILDNFSTGRAENLSLFQNKIEVFTGDIRRREDCVSAMKGVRRVFHLAAEVSVPRSVEHPLETTLVNTLGTQQLLEAARMEGVEAFVFSSTCAIYGNAQSLPISEITTPDPLSPYAVSKLAAEQIVRLYGNLFGVPGVVFRFFNVYGPRQDPSSAYSGVISAFADRLSRGEPVTIFGDGTQSRDFIYVKDVVRCMALAGKNPRAFKHPAYNLANEGGTSILDLYALLAKLQGSSEMPRFETARIGDIKHSRGSGNLLREVCGYSDLPARTSLETGLETTLSAYKETNARWQGVLPPKPA